MKKSIVKKSSDFTKKKKLLTKVYIKKILTCNEKDCTLYYLDKNGNLVSSNKAYLVNYLQLLNLLNNIQSYSYIKFPLLYGRSEQDILDKILILNQCVQERIVFYIEKYTESSTKNEIFTINDIYEKNKILRLIFLKHSNIEKFVKIYFLNESMKNKIINFKINPKNIEEKLAYYYLSQSLMTYDQPKDSVISVQLFYEFYIRLIKDEIIEKYNINISDPNIIANYQKLYAL